MKSMDYIDKLLARYLANEPLTFTQQVELEEWKNENPVLFDKLKMLSEELSSASDLEFDSQKAWDRIEPKLAPVSDPESDCKNVLDRMELERLPNSKRLPLRYLTIGFVASVLLVIGFSLSWNLQNERQTLHYANTTTEQKEIILPDHSIVKVYPKASIEYNAGKKRGDRTLSLKGQAFFTVKKIEGRPFIVQAYNTQIKVLGTSFFVDAISVNRTDVKVRAGKVSVTSNDENIILTAGEQVTVKGANMIKQHFSQTQDTAVSKPPVLKFNQTAIAKVISTLEDTFHVTIQMDPILEHNTITTIINTDNLESILTELSCLSKCKYRKIADKEYELYVE